MPIKPLSDGHADLLLYVESLNTLDIKRVARMLVEKINDNPQRFDDILHKTWPGLRTRTFTPPPPVVEHPPAPGEGVPPVAMPEAPPNISGLSHAVPNIETKYYADGSSATGPGPLPDHSPTGAPEVKAPEPLPPAA